MRSRQNVPQLTGSPGNYPADLVDLTTGSWPADAEGVPRSEWLDHAEERLVQIVDIHNFTHVSEQLPPDQQARFIKHTIAALVERIAGAMRTFEDLALEGIVNKVIGDGLLIVFPARVLDRVDLIRHAVMHAAGLVEFYHQSVQQTLRNVLELHDAIRQTDIVVVMAAARCLVGRVGTEAYYDYSVWSEEVNRSVKDSKELGHGLVWVNRRLWEALEEPAWGVGGPDNAYHTVSPELGRP